MNDYRRFSEELCKSRHAVSLTGAGISVESGIPDFRSRDGLWSRYDIAEYGYIESFRADPARVWNMLSAMGRMLEAAEPNMAHIALGELERLGIIKAVVTQNVDSLHQRAGSTNVIEFHGSFRTMHCDTCLKTFSREYISFDSLPPRCPCGGPIRPDIVFFGEAIPTQAYALALRATEECDLMLVVGTSASVAPASHLPLIAKKRGARLLEINPEKSGLSDSLSDLHIKEPAGKALGQILRVVREMKS
jgi:NAD-dependent deacetylase